MAIEIKVPALGESVTEATVGQWFKKPGEAVKVDEPLVELETDKVTVEVPSPVAGVLSDIKVAAGLDRRHRLGAGLHQGRRRRHRRNLPRQRKRRRRKRSRGAPRRSRLRRQPQRTCRQRRHAAGTRRAQDDGGEGALRRRRAGFRPARAGAQGRRGRRRRQAVRGQAAAPKPPPSCR